MLVLNDINMAARFCDVIIALHSGKMIARGAPEQIITPETLQQILGLPMEVLVHPATGMQLLLRRNWKEEKGLLLALTRKSRAGKLSARLSFQLSMW